MKTPARPEGGVNPTLYGECPTGINHAQAAIGRRALLGAALALPVAARAEALAPAGLLDTAMDAIGGKALLSRVKSIEWMGTATVWKHKVPLMMQARIEPFVSARIESWAAGKRDQISGVMTLSPQGDSLVYDGKPTPMRAQMAQYEREQYGLFGYLLLAQAPTRAQGDKLIAERPGYPRAVFTVDGKGVLTSAEYHVRSSTNEGAVGQWIEFQRSISDKGVSLPRRITIHQAGEPFLTWSVNRLSIELA